MPSESDREQAYETLAVANSNPPLEPSEVGYIELVSSPDPRVAPMAFALEHVKVRVGRFSTEGTYATSPDVYVAISADATAISPMNTMFEHVGGQFHVFDTRSANGTFVNGQPIKRRRPLAVGDVIDIGGAPEEGGARVVFRGATAPAGLPIRRAPSLTRHHYQTPRAALSVEIDSAAGRAVAEIELQGDWYATAIGAASRVAQLAAPQLPTSSVSDRVIYSVGEPLQPIVARHLLELREAGPIVADLCELASTCHAARPPIVLGPFDRRLVFTRAGKPAVLFAAGLSRVAYRSDHAKRGAMMNPLHFIEAPEESVGDAGPAADAWYAASFLIQLLTGREPFPTDDTMAYWTAIRDGQAQIPPGLPREVAQALVSDPRARPSLRALAKALR